LEEKKRKGLDKKNNLQGLFSVIRPDLAGTAAVDSFRPNLNSIQRPSTKE
jgi:hypothetical protein